MVRKNIGRDENETHKPFLDLQIQTDPLIPDKRIFAVWCSEKIGSENVSNLKNIDFPLLVKSFGWIDITITHIS